MAGARHGVSQPGVLFAVLGLAALLVPFMTLAANRIVAGEGVMAWSVAPAALTIPGLVALVLGLGLGLPAAWPRLRLLGAVLGLGGLLWLLVQGASGLLDGAGDYARVSPHWVCGAC